jgi:hypothetical protein
MFNVQQVIQQRATIRKKTSEVIFQPTVLGIGTNEQVLEFKNI